MTREGWVYVLVNEGLPGCVKVGHTLRDTKLRADELWRDYGTLYPFTVKSKHFVSDRVAVETAAHDLLDWCRVDKSEIFRCSPKVAGKAILRAAAIVLGRPWYVRLWHWIVLPRPVAPPKRLAKGRGPYHRRHNPWPLVLVIVAAMIVAALAELKPTLPDWMPDAVLRTANRIERAP